MKAAFLSLTVQLGRFLRISIESEEALISCFPPTDGWSFCGPSKISKFYPILYIDCRILRFMLDYGITFPQCCCRKTYTYEMNKLKRPDGFKNWGILLQPRSFFALITALAAAPVLMLGQEESPIIPVGTLSAYPTMVQTGTHPTLTWDVTVPEAVSDIVSIENTGTVRADRCVFADVRVLGASVKRVWKNWRGRVVHWEWVPTQGRVSQNGGSSKSFFFDTNDRVNPNKIVWSTKLASGDTLDFSGRYVRYNGSWSSTFDSRSVSQNVRALRNGDVPPTTTPLYQQPSIESFLLPFLDSEGKIKIGSRDVIYLVELTHTDANSSGFDLQDLVFLVSFYEEVETDIGSVDCEGNLTEVEDAALKQNNGHGNNYDGVDSSNPGQSPKKLNDSDPNIDDETRKRGRRRR